MKKLDLIATTKAALVAGTVAGLALGTFHYLFTEPVIDEAIFYEQLRRGPEAEPEEVLAALRGQQRPGLVLGSTILGISFAWPFVLVYSIAYQEIPGSSSFRKSVTLSLIFYLALFLVPFLKYPSNPPGVGLPETIYYRQSIYIAFTILSVAGMLAFLSLCKMFGKRPGSSVIRKFRKSIVLALYLIYIAAAFLLMPPNPDPLTAPEHVILNFRILTLVGQTLFWVVLGVVFGRFLAHRYASFNAVSIGRIRG